MNKIISNSKKAFNLLVVALLLVTITLTAKANGPADGDKNTSASTSADVKYIGTLEGQPLFNVLYNNTNGDRFSIQVQDGDGDLLFQRSFTDRKFNKKFKLTDMGAASKLIFTIRNFKDNSVQTFEVNANSRLVEDVEVTEVK